MSPATCIRHRHVAVVLLLIGLISPGMAAAVQSPAASSGSTTVAELEPPASERYPPRAVGTGARIGLIAGAGAGIAFGALLAAYAASEDDDGLSGETGAIIVGFFGLSGAAAGTLVGGWAGSLFPREPKDGRPQGTRAIGSLALTGGGATFLDRDDDGGGFLGRAAIYSHFEPWLAVGAETGILTGPISSWRLAAGVRIDPLPEDRTVRPYLAGSIGGNFWEGDLNLLSGDAGLGVEHPLKGGRSAVGLEGRYHFNLQNAVERGTYRFASVGVTWRNDW